MIPFVQTGCCGDTVTAFGEKLGPETRTAETGAGGGLVSNAGAGTQKRLWAFQDFF